MGFGLSPAPLREKSAGAQPLFGNSSLSLHTVPPHPVQRATRTLRSSSLQRKAGEDQTRVVCAPRLLSLNTHACPSRFGRG